MHRGCAGTFFTCKSKSSSFHFVNGWFIYSIYEVLDSMDKLHGPFASYILDQAHHVQRQGRNMWSTWLQANLQVKFCELCSIFVAWAFVSLHLSFVDFKSSRTSCWQLLLIGIYSATSEITFTWAGLELSVRRFSTSLDNWSTRWGLSHCWSLSCETSPWLGYLGLRRVPGDSFERLKQRY